MSFDVLAVSRTLQDGGMEGKMFMLLVSKPVMMLPYTADGIKLRILRRGDYVTLLNWAQ